MLHRKNEINKVRNLHKFTVQILRCPIAFSHKHVKTDGPDVSLVEKNEKRYREMWEDCVATSFSIT